VPPQVAELEIVASDALVGRDAVAAGTVERDLGAVVAGDVVEPGGAGTRVDPENRVGSEIRAALDGRETIEIGDYVARVFLRQAGERAELQGDAGARRKKIDHARELCGRGGRRADRVQVTLGVGVHVGSTARKKTHRARPVAGEAEERNQHAIGESPLSGGRSREAGPCEDRALVCD